MWIKQRAQVPLLDLAQIIRDLPSDSDQHTMDNSTYHLQLDLPSYEAIL
jgi:hypothetical protein